MLATPLRSRVGGIASPRPPRAPRAAPRTPARTALTAWLVATGGCAAARPSLLQRTSVATPATPTSTTARVSIDLDGARFVTPIRGVVGARSDRVQVGGRRAERTVAGWSFSREMTASLVAAVETDAGWVFVADDGLVAASHTFTGPLQRLGALSPIVGVVPWSRGRVAVVTAEGMWTSDGRTLARSETPAPVVDVVFASAQHGVARTLYGEAIVTRDGGATWTPLRDVEGPVLALTGDDCGLTASTARQRVSWRANGARRERACPVAAAAQRTPETWGDALAAYRARFPSMRGSVRLGDGASLAIEREDDARDTLVRRDADGRERGRRPLGFTADLQPWGAAALLWGRHTAWRATDEHTLEQILAPERDCGTGANWGSAVAADDGVHLLIGRCVYDGASWRDVSLPQGQWVPVSARGSTALMLNQYDLSLRSWRTVDLATGDPSAVEIDADLAEDARCFFSLGVDGAVAGLCAPPGAPGVFAIGRAGSMLRVLPAPAGASRVAFADARRGVAMGERARDVWRTLDGGEHWEPVPVPCDEGAPRTGYEDRDLLDRCDDDGCTLGPLPMRLSGWGAMESSDERLLLGGLPRAASATRYQCDDRGVATGLPERVFAWNRGYWWRTATAIHWLDLDGAQGDVAFPTTVEPAEVVARTRDGLVIRRDPHDLQLVRGARSLDLLGPLSSRDGAGLLVPTESPAVSAPTDDGGAVLMLHATSPAPDVEGEVVVVAEFTFEGRLRGSRVVLRSARGATGIARHARRWGHAWVSLDRTVWFAPLDGGPAATIGRIPDAVTPCAGAAHPDATTLRLEQDPRAPIVDLRGLFGVIAGHVEVELAGASACLRAVRSMRNRNGPPDLSSCALTSAQGGLTGSSLSSSVAMPMRCEVAR